MMTSCPKAQGGVTEKGHHYVIGTKKFLGWGRSWGGGGKCHNVGAQLPQNKGG